MTVEELIASLRRNRQGSNRSRVTETIHALERFSFGTEVTISKGVVIDLDSGIFSCHMKDGYVVLSELEK